MQMSGKLPLGNTHINPLDMRVGWPHSQSGRYGEQNNLLLLPRIEPRSSSPRLYRVRYPGSFLKKSNHLKKQGVKIANATKLK
jgi:hypothetical protein